MIDKCNFKSDVSMLKPYRNYKWECDFTHNRCPDENNCILFQIYKSLQPSDDLVDIHKPHAY